MSSFLPTVEFSPADLSDGALAELRRLALSAMAAAPRFTSWLHEWCDTEQARRARGETTCTQRHALGLPLLQPWSQREVGEALEAVGVLVHTVGDVTASAFVERLQMAVSGEAALRLRTTQPSEGDDHAS